jgi:hypothetical protein
MRHYIAVGYFILLSLALYCVHFRFSELTFGDFETLATGDLVLAMACLMIVLVAPYVFVFTELRYWGD